MPIQPPVNKGQLANDKYPQLKPLWIAVFMDVLGFSLLVPILPYLMISFNVDPFTIGLLLSVNAIASFISGPLWGGLSDKIGRKPVLLITQSGTLAGFLLLAFSFQGQVWMVFLSRAIDGMFGGILTVSRAIIADVVSPQNRGRQMTNIGIVFTLSNIVGPLVGSLLIGVTVTGFPVIGPGLLASACCIGMILLTIAYVRESAPAKVNPTGLASRSGESVPTSKGEGQKSTSWGSTARFLLVQWALVSFAFIVYITSISLFAYERLQLSAQELGLFLSVTGMAQIILRFAAFEPMLKKLGEHKTAAIGLLAFTVSYLLMGFVPDGIPGVVGLFCVLLGVTFGSVCTRGILTGYLSRAVPPADQGKAMGFSAAIDSLSQVFGPLVGTSIITALPLFVFGLVPSLLTAVAFAMAFKPLVFVQAVPVGAKHAPPQETRIEHVHARVSVMKDACVEHAEYAKACEE
ncbi:MAG: MFS transporter [Candidatus Lokiarchaeota archaeon]|nr:MFS transporter [Candidatus Lokiarchaeota archaeon]